jgi:Caspase domain
MKAYPIFFLVCLVVVAGGGTKDINGQSISRDLNSPEIVIVSPGTSDLTTRQGTLIFKGIVLSYKLPLIEVMFLVNGNVVETKKPDAQSLYRYQFEIPIKLTPGPNRATIVARNEKGQSKLESGTIVFDDAAGIKPRLVVLSIGLSIYADPSLDLPFPELDATAFARKMAAQADCAFRETQVNVLVGKEATRSAILRGLDWLNKTASSPEDVRVVFISGRAGRDDSGTYYLLSSEHSLEGDFDASDIRDDLLWNRLNEVSGSVLVFMDRTLAGFVGASPAMQRRMSPPPNITAIINPFGFKPQFGGHTSNHGAFTFTLLEGLSKNASQDRVVDIEELFKWMQAQLPVVTKSKQQPTFFGEPNRKPAAVFCIP